MRLPEEIIASAIQDHSPTKVFVGYSGGDGSLVTAHWMMNNVPGCEVFHCNTGIGIETTRRHVRKVCKQFGWPLTEICAKEDCGQDYDEMVRKVGFPGPAMHGRMQQRLKGRAIRKLAAMHKKKYSQQKIILATGVSHDDSARRSRYGGREVNVEGAVVWVNPLYWWKKTDFYNYIRDHDLPRNPVSVTLGMSGECLCGAFSHPGELALVKIVCPETHARIVKLEVEVRAAGHDWGWEDRPPRKQRACANTKDMFMPFCHGCEKTGEPA